MSPSSDLDEVFGPPLGPKYVREAEQRANFSNTFAVDPLSARYLAELAEMCLNYPTFRDLALNLCFLWAVDIEGEIWVTMEEVCLLGHFGKRFPRMRNMPLDASLAALGHPLLVNRGQARIAGELMLDNPRDGMQWVINNKSGRYGFGEHRAAAHLENVAAAFARVGLIVETHYIEGR